MVASVIRPCWCIVKVYLPYGEWGHWWTHKVISDPAWILVSAPLEYPVAFDQLGSPGEDIARQLSGLL